jgi:hypothetical protein
MKAGTTWLYSILSTHPEICFCEEKEVHYFSHIHGVQPSLELEKRIARFKQFANSLRAEDYNSRWVQRRMSWFTKWLREPLTDKWYRELFPIMASERYMADFSNLTALVPREGWNHIRSLSNKLKVIYIVRDPIERLWSHVKFHSKFVGELDSFLESSPEEVLRLARMKHIWANGEYGAILEGMRHVLTKEELLVLNFDFLHKDPEGELKKIERFLDISEQKYADRLLYDKVNPSHQLSAPQFFIEEFSRDTTRIMSEFENEARKMLAAGYTMSGFNSIKPN